MVIQAKMGNSDNMKTQRKAVKLNYIIKDTGSFQCRIETAVALREEHGQKLTGGRAGLSTD